jgi:small subunit ribosomal protein S16
MAVKIRLKRLGSKKNAHFRLVAADSRSPRDGKVIEELGYYDPNTNPSEIKIKVEAAQKWLATGAAPTESAKILLKKAGVVVS